MPTWDEILKETGAVPNNYDLIRRKYIKALSEYTGRNTIVYYSGFVQKQILAQNGVDFSINDNDKNGFMTVIKGLDKQKGLDLVLQTPGGSVAATESIVHYLKSIFGNDIRAIVPQIAMSAGTMTACACKEIVMGKQSNLGPIDPQLGGLPVHGILEEFYGILNEVKKDPASIVFWRELLQKYHPTLIGECQKAIAWGESMVANWLKSNMFINDPDKDKTVSTIMQEIGSHNKTLSHGRHIHVDDLEKLGFKITKLESDSELQDRVLSVHHATIISITQTKATKIIENNNGKSFIQVV